MRILDPIKEGEAVQIGTKGIIIIIKATGIEMPTIIIMAIGAATIMVGQRTTPTMDRLSMDLTTIIHFLSIRLIIIRIPLIM